MIKRELQKNVKRYIRGQLSGNEEDELWEEFLADAELYHYFEMNIHLMAAAMDERDDIDINDIEGEGEWWEFTDEFIAVPIDQDDDEEE